MDPLEAREKLIVSLAEVNERFNADADDWQYRLLRVYREYSRAIGIEKSLLMPLQVMLYEEIEETRRTRRTNGAGRPPKPISETLALTVAAAAVTVLRERGDCPNIEAALKAVAKATGLERKRIKSFRNNIHSATAPEEAVKAYPDYVTEVGSWPTLETLSALPKFIRNPSITNT